MFRFRSKRVPMLCRLFCSVLFRFDFGFFRFGAFCQHWHGFRQISLRAVLSMETSADRAFRSANQNRAGYPSRVTEEDKASSTVDDADGRIGYSPEGRAYRGSDSDDEKEGRKQVRSL